MAKVARRGASESRRGPLTQEERTGQGVEKRRERREKRKESKEENREESRGERRVER